jgi:hypothetical protein
MPTPDRSEPGEYDHLALHLVDMFTILWVFDVGRLSSFSFRKGNLALYR